MKRGKSGFSLPQLPERANRKVRGFELMLKSLLRRIVAALGIPLLVGAVPAEARAPVVAHPALWEVSDPDTTIYLFGTIHLLPPNSQWRTSRLDAAVANAQE